MDEKFNSNHLKALKEVNVLGYAGTILALIFEILSSWDYKGKVNIYPNDDVRRAPYPFENDIKYEIISCRDVKIPPTENFIFCSSKPTTKKFLMDFFVKNWRLEKEQFTTICHSSSVIASTTSLAGGLLLEPLSVVSPYNKIGFGVTINRNCSTGHHNILNDYCTIQPGVNIAGHVEIGKGAIIGPGSTIFNSIKIGKNSIIGGGSVVTKNIPENVLAYGNPCKIIKDIQT